MRDDTIHTIGEGAGVEGGVVVRSTARNQA